MLASGAIQHAPLKRVLPSLFLRHFRLLLCWDLGLRLHVWTDGYPKGKKRRQCRVTGRQILEVFLHRPGLKLTGLLPDGRHIRCSRSPFGRLLPPWGLHLAGLWGRGAAGAAADAAAGGRGVSGSLAALSGFAKEQREPETGRREQRRGMRSRPLQGLGPTPSSEGEIHPKIVLHTSVPSPLSATPALESGSVRVGPGYATIWHAWPRPRNHFVRSKRGVFHRRIFDHRSKHVCYK